MTKIKSPEEPLAKIAKLAKEKRRERGDGDTDHIAEITQLKEKIASLQKTITSKHSELVSKQVCQIAFSNNLQRSTIFCYTHFVMGDIIVQLTSNLTDMDSAALLPT